MVLVAMDATARTSIVHCPCTFCRSLSSPGALLTRMRPISFEEACALIDRHPLLRQHLIVRQLLDMGAEPHEIVHTSLPLPLLLPEEWRVAILDNMERDVSVARDPKTAAMEEGSTVTAFTTTTDVATETDIVVDDDGDEGDDGMVAADINDNLAGGDDGDGGTRTNTTTITATPTTTISLATLLKYPSPRSKGHGGGGGGGGGGRDHEYILLGKHNRNKRR